MSIYSGQFLSKRSDSRPDDGRVEILSELKKIHRGGSQRPGTLAKRAGDAAGSDEAIRYAAKTSAELRLESNARAALDAVKKSLRAPSGYGVLLPDEPARKARTDIGSLQVSPRAIQRMLERRGNLRKDSRTPALVDGLPRGSGNSSYADAPASRAGADSSATAGYSSTAMPAGGVSKPYGASAAAVTSGRADAPEDSDLGGKRKKRHKHHARDDSSASVDTSYDDDADDDTDDDDDDDDSDLTMAAIKAAHRAGVKRSW